MPPATPLHAAHCTLPHCTLPPCMLPHMQLVDWHRLVEAVGHDLLQELCDCCVEVRCIRGKVPVVQQECLANVGVREGNKKAFHLLHSFTL
jgi:hypothetical protein